MPWTPKYPMGLTQVPKPMALTPFVMLSFQCLVASSLGQSMPHSCSFRDPIGFTFSLSGYMPATKKHYVLPLAVQILTALLSKFVPYGDHNFKDKCGIKLKIIKKTDPVHTLRPRDSLLSTRFIPFLLPEVQEAHPTTKVDP